MDNAGGAQHYPFIIILSAGLLGAPALFSPLVGEGGLKGIPQRYIRARGGRGRNAGPFMSTPVLREPCC